MRIGASLRQTDGLTEPKVSALPGRRFSMGNMGGGMDTGTVSGGVRSRAGSSRIAGYGVKEEEEERSEAERIYQAVVAGKSAVESIRQAPSVPYGYLAKDGVITYNGVTFVCDEKTNSICLGYMDDKKQVLNIPLSGGGHLKVNRANLGDLAKAIGMFSPEDANRIMRAIHQDAKIQSVQQELEEMENSVGEPEPGLTSSSDAET